MALVTVTSAEEYGTISGATLTISATEPNSDSFASAILLAAERLDSSETSADGHKTKIRVEYADADTSGNDWEIWECTYNSSGNTITLNRRINTSDGGGAITWSGDTVRAFGVVTHEDTYPHRTDCYAHVNLTSAQAITTAKTQLTGFTVVKNEGSAWSGNVFTAPLTGVYMVDYKPTLTVGADGDLISTTIANASESTLDSISTEVGGASTQTLPIMSALLLDKGDQLKFFIQNANNNDSVSTASIKIFYLGGTNL